ncbi:class I SAM-dependent methyltransferase [Geodermatophilus sp. SYSU D00742]
MASRSPARLARWTIPHLRVRPDDRVLGLGCASGATLGRLSAAAFLSEVVGLDPSPQRVRRAARRHRRALRDGRVRIGCGDAVDPPEADASFDRVCLVDLLPGPDRLHRLREAYRVLRPAGRVAVAVRAGGGCGAEVAALLSAAGFRDVDWVVHPGRWRGRLCAWGTKG